MPAKLQLCWPHVFGTRWRLRTGGYLGGAGDPVRYRLACQRGYCCASHVTFLDGVALLGYGIQRRAREECTSEERTVWYGACNVEEGQKKNMAHCDDDMIQSGTLQDVEELILILILILVLSININININIKYEY